MLLLFDFFFFSFLFVVAVVVVVHFYSSTSVSEITNSTMENINENQRRQSAIFFFCGSTLFKRVWLFNSLQRVSLWPKVVDDCSHMEADLEFRI